MAHVAVTTTQPMLDCLWLEKVPHTHAKNTINTSKRPQPQIPAKEARASFPFQLILTKHSGQHSEGRALITKQPKCSLKQNLKSQTNRLSSRRVVAQPTGSFKNQTNHVSFQLRFILGTASNAMWQLKGYLCHLPVL